MNLKQLQAAISTYRAEATEQELESLSEMLSHELNTTDERLEEIETERLDAIEEAERQAWEESPEGKEDAEYFRNVISLWYRNEEKVVTVNGDRRHPNQGEICIEERLGSRWTNLLALKHRFKAM